MFCLGRRSSQVATLRCGAMYKNKDGEPAGSQIIHALQHQLALSINHPLIERSNITASSPTNNSLKTLPLQRSSLTSTFTMSIYEDNTGGELDYVVRTMNLSRTHTNARVPLICIFKDDKPNNRHYTYFGISQGIVEQNAEVLGNPTVRKYGKIHDRDFERFKQIVATTSIPKVPNMSHPCPQKIFNLWLDDVLQNLESNACLRRY